jgi:hypothetical protein
MDMFSYLLGKKSSSGGGGGIDMESGSNQYGTYIKFGTGDMIMYGQMQVDANSNWGYCTFPEEFKDDNYYVITNVYGGGADYGGSAGMKTFTASQKYDKTKCYIYSYRQSDQAMTHNRLVNWVAFGKWK